jgi:periplasmic divalent cation tolerance protein
MLSRIALSARCLAASKSTTHFRAASSLHSRATPLSRELKSQKNSITTTTTMATTTGASPSPSSTTSTDVAVVYCTAPNPEVARSLARHLVEEPRKLAACVNVLPGVTSIYSWKGKVEEDGEVLMIIKTRKELLQRLTDEIKAKHPYEEPEVLALPAIGGSDSYLRWVIAETTRGSGELRE